MLSEKLVERGQTGRIVYARIRPNEDLVQAVEKLCLQHHFRHAIIRGSLGSVSQAALDTPRGAVEVAGPAVEVLNLQGEVTSNDKGTPSASLSGVVADPEGRIYGGRFISGSNPVCITMELVLEEWIGSSEVTS